MVLASFGIAYELLAAADVSEIHIIGQRILAKKHGINETVPQTFESDEAVVGWINHLLERAEQPPLDTANPIREFHVSNNGRGRSRVFVMLPPLSPAPVVTIAKQTLSGVTLGQLVQGGSMSYDAADFLEECVTGRANILIAGRAGAGKTTLMSALLALIPADEVLGVIEEVPEIMAPHENTVSMYNRPLPSPDRRVPLDSVLGALVEWAEQATRGGELASSELNARNALLWLGERSLRSAGMGAEPVTLSRLVRESLRMRIDRIALGEVRGPEAVDLLVAMNTGVLGSMGTIHSNSAREAITKLQTLGALGGYPPSYLLSLISQAIDVVVYLRAPVAGNYGIQEIIEVPGRMVNETTITTQVLFAANEKGELERQAQPSLHLNTKLT